MPVEVLIFTFNQQDYVKDAIQSVVSQVTNFEFNIRVHDDHSTDKTVFLAQELLESSGIPFEIVVQSSNQYQKGMNFFAEAILNSDAQFLALLDGDDLWTDSSKLQTQFEVLTQNPDVSICHHPFGFLRGEEYVFEDWRPTHLRREKVPGEMLAEQNFIGASTVMLRNSCMPRTIPSGFNNLKIGDYPLWALISDNSYIYELDSFMSLYREHDSNVFAGLETNEKIYRDLQARAFIATQVTKDHQRRWIDELIAAVGSQLGINALESQIQDLNSKLALSEQTAEYLSTEITELRQSTSWKITSFLRTFSRFINRNT